MECDCKIGGESGRHIVVPCQGHRGWMEANVREERERCARFVELHENYVRDHSRDVFVRRIAEKLRKGGAPDPRELKFAETMKT